MSRPKAKIGTGKAVTPNVGGACVLVMSRVMLVKFESLRQALSTF